MMAGLALWVAGCLGSAESGDTGVAEQELTTSCFTDADCATSLNGRQCVSGACTHYSLCYGAQGAECDGVPNGPCTSLGGSLVKCGVTVGSQYHDRCCAQAQANGQAAYMCMGSGTGPSLCSNEWNRAANDQLWGYMWFATFDRNVRIQDSPTLGLAGVKAPSGTKIAVNDAKAGWCRNGYYTINFGLQAVCK
jgi:hypothetical protein